MRNELKGGWTVVISSKVEKVTNPTNLNLTLDQLKNRHPSAPHQQDVLMNPDQKEKKEFGVGFVENTQEKIFESVFCQSNQLTLLFWTPTTNYL